MTFLMYIAGLVGIITMAAGAAALSINVPHNVVHIEVKRPNTMLRIAGIVLMIGGVLNLVGNVYFGVKHWQNDHGAASLQSETSPPKPDAPLPPPGG